MIASAIGFALPTIKWIASKVQTAGDFASWAVGETGSDVVDLISRIPFLGQQEVLITITYLAAIFFVVSAADWAICKIIAWRMLSVEKAPVEPLNVGQQSPEQTPSELPGLEEINRQFADANVEKDLVSPAHPVLIVHRKDEHYWSKSDGSFQGSIAIENTRNDCATGVYAKITRIVPRKNKAQLMSSVDRIVNCRLDIDAEFIREDGCVKIPRREQARAWVIKNWDSERIMINNADQPSAALIPKGSYELTITIYSDHGNPHSMEFVIGQSRSGAATFRPKAIVRTVPMHDHRKGGRQQNFEPPPTT